MIEGIMLVIGKIVISVKAIAMDTMLGITFSNVTPTLIVMSIIIIVKTKLSIICVMNTYDF